MKRRIILLFLAVATTAFAGSSPHLDYVDQVKISEKRLAILAEARQFLRQADGQPSVGYRRQRASA